MPQKTTRSKGSSIAPLLFADTRRCADQRYVAGFSVPDAFISFQAGRKWHAVLNQLEFARALKDSKFDVVLPFEDWVEKARERFKKAGVGYPEVIVALAESFGIEEFKVPADFPSRLAFSLQELGVKVSPEKGSLFPKREVKSAQELAFIREGNRCSAEGIRAAERALRKSEVRRGKLYLEGKLLTSERLREIIEVACLRVGSVSMDTIAAGGDQACDPHCAGHGPLRANELIIVDVFPQVARTGYHGDMTRTFLKGRASEAQKRIVEAVRAAQSRALAAVKAGVNGKSVHAQSVKTFEELGFETRRDANGSVGFFHGTGHGLGLEVHEAPRVSVVSNRLKENTVVTIEPGLYYPGLGGCRIEDVVAVKKGGCELLSSYHYRWQLP